MPLAAKGPIGVVPGRAASLPVHGPDPKSVGQSVVPTTEGNVIVAASTSYPKLRSENSPQTGCALAFRRSIAERVQCRLGRCLAAWHIFPGITAARCIINEGKSLGARKLRRVRRATPCPNGIAPGVMLHPPSGSVLLASKIRAPHFYGIHHAISPNPTPV